MEIFRLSEQVFTKIKPCDDTTPQLKVLFFQLVLHTHKNRWRSGHWYNSRQGWRVDTL